MKNIFRIVAFLEGVSYILLLFIAVPIKYNMGDPTYVKLLGMPHGILFISYIIMCFILIPKSWDNLIPQWVLRKNNWPKGMENYKELFAVIICLLFSIFWTVLLWNSGWDNLIKNRHGFMNLLSNILEGVSLGMIVFAILPYLCFIQFIWKTIVGGKKLIMPHLYIYLIASILPFGTFYIDWKYLRN